MLNKLLKRPIDDLTYSYPNVITGTKTFDDTGMMWYQALIDYRKVEKLIEGYVGKVAVLDDTAYVTNGYLERSVDTIYDFTGEGGSSSYHGHHVSGIIASIKHGLYKNMRVGLFKVLSANDGKGTSLWVQKAIDACIVEGYGVINASLGSPMSDKGLEKSVRHFCSSPKNFFVAAAGNENAKANSPARLAGSCKGVISVGALGYKDNTYYIPTFSNYGEITVVAAGVDITSTFPYDKEETLTGTSMATPFISGLIAAAKAIYPEFDQDTFYYIIDDLTCKLSAEEKKQGKGKVKIVDFLERVHSLKDEHIKIPEQVLQKTHSTNIFKNIYDYIKCFNK
jgi:subtilisin family serine protease